MSDKNLTLVLMPNCEPRFTPPYVYERYAEPCMNGRIIHGIKRFIERRMDTIETLDIRWTGFEPLLRLDVMEAISIFVRNILEFYGQRPYRASLSTTGYFLDTIRVKKLLSIGIYHYQISLENPLSESEERIQIPEQVLKNLKEIAALPPEDDFRVTVYHSVVKDSDLEWFRQEIGNDERIVLKQKPAKKHREASKKTVKEKKEPRIAYVFHANGEIEVYNMETGKGRKTVGEINQYGIAKFYPKQNKTDGKSEMREENKSVCLDK